MKIIFVYFLLLQYHKHSISFQSIYYFGLSGSQVAGRTMVQVQVSRAALM